MVFDIDDTGRRIPSLAYRQFLAMLRLALHGNMSNVLETCKIDWNALYSICEKQNLIGLCFSAIEKLPKSKLPDMVLLMDWAGQAENVKTLHNYQKQVIRDLGAFLNDYGLRMMIMKGYGCSQNYPIPALRPTGDIDIVVLDRYGELKGKEAEAIIEDELKIRIDRNNSHHSVFYFKDCMVENHWTIMDVNKHKSNLLVEDLLSGSISDARECDMEGVCLPSCKFNSIHLLRHMASDFATSHTTMRHVLDWATFVHANDVDWEFVHDVAKKTNMSRFLDALNCICVEYLGYDEAQFPVLVHDEALRDRVLGDILDPSDSLIPVLPGRDAGIFEKIAYGIAKTRRMIANRWKYQIVYDETLWESFVGLATNRLKH